MLEKLTFKILVNLVSIKFSRKGMPPVIYLALNKTVRRDVYRMCVRVIPCVNPPPLHSSIASVAGGLPPSNTRNRVGPSSNVGPSIH